MEIIAFFIFHLLWQGTYFRDLLKRSLDLQGVEIQYLLSIPGQCVITVTFILASPEIRRFCFDRVFHMPTILRNVFTPVREKLKTALIRLFYLFLFLLCFMRIFQIFYLFS